MSRTWHKAKKAKRNRKGRRCPPHTCSYCDSSRHHRDNKRIETANESVREFRKELDV